MTTPNNLYLLCIANIGICWLSLEYYILKLIRKVVTKEPSITLGVWLNTNTSISKFIFG